MKEYKDVKIEQEQIKNAGFRGAGAVLFGRFTCYFIQLFGTVILARLLMPEDFGLVAMVTIFTMILVEFGTLRLTEATLQRDDIDHQQVSTLLWINVILCSVFAVLLILVAPLIAWFYKDPRLQMITVVLAASFIFTGFASQHLALIQRNMFFYRFAFIQIGAVVFSTLISIYSALMGLGYWSIISRQLSLSFFTMIFAWMLFPWRPGKYVWSQEVKEMILFGLHSLGSYFIGYIRRSADKLLLGWMHGSTVLGFYDRAYHLFVMPINQMVFPLTSVAVATLSRLRNERDQYKRYYFSSVWLIAMVGAPIGVVLTLSGVDITILLLGPKWRVAGEIFTVFAPGIPGMLIYGTLAWLHFSLGNADRLFRWNLFSTSFSIVAFLIGVQYGAIGVAVAFSSTYYILLIPGIVYAGLPVHITYKELLGTITRPILASIGAGAVYLLVLKYSHFTIPVNTTIEALSAVVIKSSILIALYTFFIVVLYRSFWPLKKCYRQFVKMLPTNN